MNKIMKLLITFVIALSMISILPAETTVAKTDAKAEVATQIDVADYAVIAMEDSKKKKKKKIKKKKWKWGKKKKKGSSD
ncbi:MAG: hypothetical protein HOK52_01190 [Candidatus Marinimicrobia bacterium]|jgi:hypothetical protein|nr:hypothetical protein [Candidatus Neomarinimicrobiota bacterium]MBT3937063.1 hypothetical protein [Candidatus Neomarinimicrobiota bacterium]MBT3962033.1 hypothetical protein [Candidatus Neomarinimicrobiota bacterium]MBT4382401.1 hypothetical protein [Candidatus Neomarinimicrobiota bacterium]MBT4636518.1 hypothetical protein [Candidatus Neomarinimicrobiota bacterium]